MFSQAPARVAVDAGAKTPRRYRALVVSRARRTPGGASGPLGDDGPAAVLKTLPNATQAAYWLRRAAREEQRGDFESALGFLEQGIKRHARPSEDLAAAKATLEAKMRAKDAAAAETKTRGSDVVVTTAVTPARVDAFPRGSARRRPRPPSAAGPSPAQKHCATPRSTSWTRSWVAQAPDAGVARRSEKTRAVAADAARHERERERHALGGCPPASRGATPSAAHVLRRQLTPNSELPRSRWRWRRRRRSRDARRRGGRARREGGGGGDADAPGIREGIVAHAGSRWRARGPSRPGRRVSAPRRPRCRAPPAPPQRACWGRLPRASPRPNLGPFPSSSAVSSEMLSPATMLPSLPTPTAEIPSLANARPGPSPGRRRAGVRGGMHLADFGGCGRPWRAAPGSVETRRGRSSRSPAVVAAPLRLARRRSPRRRTASRGRSRHPPRCRR